MFAEAVAEYEAVALIPPRDLHDIARGIQSVSIAADLLNAMREIARLPVSGLTPEEVIEQQCVDVPPDELWHEVAAGRLWASYDGIAKRRLFPAWQFVEPVSELMPAVMDVLLAADCIDPCDFWESQFGEIADLTPAELLSGKLFAARRSVSIDQADYLAMPDIERQRVVLTMHDLLVSERRGTLG
ncbi:hypothetical protein [Cupriavidus pauculus]|uniref:Uncharacterized protein n=1 Tax=Cupriavidus pauculus TaxID=82633 RepID=A0A2N5C7B7_9BURK|nr:hypothetical protein [Cupriavidus pauculus]PLP98109.1 hypothetical protein CYJ10_23590 [Cupriavidus pauculus]